MQTRVVRTVAVVSGVLATVILTVVSALVIVTVTVTSFSWVNGNVIVSLAVIVTSIGNACVAASVTWTVVAVVTWIWT